MVLGAVRETKGLELPHRRQVIYTEPSPQGLWSTGSSSRDPIEGRPGGGACSVGERARAEATGRRRPKVCKAQYRGQFSWGTAGRVVGDEGRGGKKGRSLTPSTGRTMTPSGSG